MTTTTTTPVDLIGKCASCIHFAVRRDHQTGICLERPPHPVPPDRWAYPEAEYDGSCSLYAPTREATEAAKLHRGPQDAAG